MTTTTTTTTSRVGLQVATAMQQHWRTSRMLLLLSLLLLPRTAGIEEALSNGGPAVAHGGK